MACLNKIGVVRFHHIEIEGATISFQMHDNSFNVNGLTRELAEREVCSSLGRSWNMREPRWPNVLRVRILRARNLGNALRYSEKSLVSPKVFVRVRGQAGCTRTYPRTQAPMIDETLVFKATDPSAVLHIEVRDKSTVQNKVIGNWVMTLKYFFTG